MTAVENEIDPFEGMDDTLPTLIRNNRNHDPQRTSPSFPRSYSQKNPAREILRPPSQELLKFRSMGRMSNAYSRQGSTLSDTKSLFQVNSKALEGFYHNENKWQKKVGGWFSLPENGIDSTFSDIPNESLITSDKNKNYMYEIRNMVLNSRSR